MSTEPLLTGATSRSPQLVSVPPREHGGGLDAAMARWGGTREDWLDLSTGINPVPYPLPEVPRHAWTALPDRRAEDALLTAARSFWRVPDGAEIVAAPGLSALIALLPRVSRSSRVAIPWPVYNEWEATWLLGGSIVDRWREGAPAEAPGGMPKAAVAAFVHPNNPTGHLWSADEIRASHSCFVDESFCDVLPERSHVDLATEPGRMILKSFGKFWGLAGVRLGFAILKAGPRAQLLRESLGPWPVSGPALAVGTAALNDPAWAEATRARLAADAARLDALLTAHRASIVGGTPLFRLYAVDDAQAWHDRLARAHVLTRVFPYSRTWLRLGLPAPDRWAQLESAL